MAINITPELQAEADEKGISVEKLLEQKNQASALSKLQTKAQEELETPDVVKVVEAKQFRPTPSGTTPTAPTPTGQMEDISSLPGRIQNLQKQMNPEQKSAAVDAAAAPLSNALDKSDSKEADVFKSRLDELRAEKQQAFSEYQQNKNRVANAELIDALGKGIAQLAAGWYGLNTGRDAVSGVDFKPKDWSSNYLLAERDYKLKKSDVEEEIKDIRGEQREIAKEERAEKAYERRLTAQEEREGKGLEKEKRRSAEKEKELRGKLTRDLASKLENLRVAKGKDRKKLEGEVAGSLRELGVPADAVKAAMESYSSPFIGYDYSPLEKIIEQLQRTSEPAPKPAAQPQAQPAAGGPSVGTITNYKGKQWRYKGGDPAEVSSWEAVQ